MIQFKTTILENTAVETIKSLIAKEAKWIRMTVSSDISDETYNNISGLCKDAGVILTIEDDYESLKKFHCHGIHLNQGSVHAQIVRNELGAEPIVGVTVQSPSEVIALRGNDVDYVQIQTDTPTLEWYLNFANKVHSANVDIKLVVPVSDIDNEHINDIINAGIDGVVYSV